MPRVLHPEKPRPPVESWVAIYVRMRLALATLARQVEVLDYVDPPRAAPLEETVRQLENLLAALAEALSPAASPSRVSRGDIPANDASETATPIADRLSQEDA